MGAPSKNHLLRLAQPLFWLLDELSPELESLARLDALKSEARARLATYKAASHAAGHKADGVEAVHYCFCAAMDQAGSRVRGRANSLRGAWLQPGLLAELYGENSAGHRCRAWIATLLQAPNVFGDALEVLGQLIDRGLRDEYGAPLPRPEPARHSTAVPVPLAAAAAVPSPIPVLSAADPGPKMFFVHEEPQKRSRAPVVIAAIVAVLAVMLALVVYLQHRANQALTDKVNQLSTQVASVESAQSDALAHMVVSADLGFAPGRAELTSMLARQLDQLATALATTRGVIKIVGHTDDSPGPKGSLESNLALSEARAMAVGRYLHGRGIAMGRMVIIGRGAQDPIGDNRTAAGRALNRRVEITLDRLRDAAS
ncbi:Peptidoglycan-associated lipoprotein [Ralstonia condita]|uniref:Peptidoglycan-associated lipoprotein n=1 Tax=Ralstonia condita TaxID=3058600 RepID=A0ABM9IZB5_9RALS|nr:DotU family type IV/VI secretion system protein [Ralstonia sp. LMG 7141]CAJ0777262.1 Peptidoglycan-associated lipoprotein [Ralstonia sp. LMG 7141]